MNEMNEVYFEGSLEDFFLYFSTFGLNNPKEGNLTYDAAAMYFGMPKTSVN